MSILMTIRIIQIIIIKITDKEVINKTVIEKQRIKASTELKRSLSQNDSV